MNSQTITLHDIAGFCTEEAIWKMMADLSSMVGTPAAPPSLSPAVVTVDGSAFYVSDNVLPDAVFMPPEQPAAQRQCAPEGLVWAIGALACYAATGHVLFGGRGGTYQRQHQEVALPVLPKAMQQLTPVVQRCLHAKPGERIGAAELHDAALEQLERCKRKVRPVAPKRAEEDSTTKNTMAGQRWPEEMSEQ